MAEFDDDAPQPVNPSIPTENELHPALEAARGAFDTPESEAWGDGIITQVQQHLNAARVADANQAAGNQFVQNLGDTKDALINMVKGDPTSADLAMRLTPELYAGMLAHMPGETGDAVNAELTRHTRQEVARAAITRMAEVNEGGARALKDQLGEHLEDTDHAVLDHYITAQQAAREADHGASVQQMIQQNARASGMATLMTANQLYDAKTESVKFPPNYMANLVADTSLAPQDKQALYVGYNNLRSYGDAPASNPHVLTSMVSDLANTSAGDIAHQVGTNLKYADAMTLQALGQARVPEAHAAVQQLADVLTNARDTLTANGDHAGDVAFGRFVNWLMPAYRQAGPAGLNPASDSYLFANATPGQFMARHEDIVPQQPVAGRPSLQQIFAAGRNFPDNYSQGEFYGAYDGAEPEDTIKRGPGDLPSMNNRGGWNVDSDLARSVPPGTKDRIERPLGPGVDKTPLADDDNPEGRAVRTEGKDI